MWGSGAPTGTGYKKVFSTAVGIDPKDKAAFVALKEDGTLHPWGSNEHGGGSNSNSKYTNPPTDSGYVNVFSNQAAFVALKEDGTLHPWGSNEHGGNSTTFKGGFRNWTEYPGAPMIVVMSMVSSGSAFVAIKADGSLSAGNPSRGGKYAPAGSGWVKVFSSTGGFVALKADGPWGNGHVQVLTLERSIYQRGF